MCFYWPFGLLNVENLLGARSVIFNFLLFKFLLSEISIKCSNFLVSFLKVWLKLCVSLVFKIVLMEIKICVRCINVMFSCLINII